MGAVLFLGYFTGVLVAAFAMRARAGVGIVHRLKIFGPDGFGPVWFATVVGASMIWPVTLVRWLLRGRPEPAVVFNDKALERERRLMGGSGRL